MKYGTIPYVNKKVSKLILGTAVTPFITGGDGSETLNSALKNGINAFDMARNYGLSEYAFGNWLEKSGVRDEIVIISKCAHPNIFGRKRVSERDIKKDFRSTTYALRTNYIDIYLLHRDDLDVDVSVAVETFNQLHAEGKIGAFGASNWSHARIEEANEYAYKKNLIPFSVSSPNFGLAEQVNDPWGGGCVTVSGEVNKKAREWYARNRMPIMAYSSLGRGFFSGRLKSDDCANADRYLDAVAMRGYACKENFERLKRCEILAKEKGVTVAQIALAWIYGSDMDVYSVASMSNEDKMQANIQALNMRLTVCERDYLDLRRDVLQ